MVVNGDPLDAFGDTGSCHNIVDKDYVRRCQTVTIRSNETLQLRLGDKSTLLSHGVVELDVSFADEPGKSCTILARVVRNFPFDLLLGKQFLKGTKTLTNFMHRFKPCVFPRLTAGMSFNFIGHKSERLSVALDRRLVVGALLDTGSNCNVMDLEWATKNALEVKTSEDHRGWMSFPSGERKPTVGQVNTEVTLPDGSIVSSVFEVLENCVTPIVLGDEVIFKHKLYEKTFSYALFEDNNEFSDELLHMDYKPWYHKVVRKIKRKLKEQDSGKKGIDTNESEEMERQWQWDRDNAYGKQATIERWMAEYYQRKDYQKKLHPNVDIDDRSLIRYVA
ncbi:hypothetical protein N0V90_010861 [Kalmusia sp. IMI 367209]|nr:hypothetical protein N0V90_010861 [Kalmusia sp. IMI 367209]